MMAPLPKRRSICCKARSIAFSRSLLAADTAVLLRSAMDFSFLVIGMLTTGYRQGCCHPASPPLHSSFLMARNNKQAQSYLLHFLSSLVDTRSYSFAGLK